MSSGILFLGKLVALAASPIGAVLLICLLSLVIRRRNLARGLVLLAVLVLWIASMPAFANLLYRGLEARYPARPVADLPVADVVVVLGGVIGQPLPPRIVPDLGGPIDRVFHAARIFRAGKAGIVVVAGGNQPWQSSVRPEAELIADILVELGVPRQAILIEGASRNTYENAINSTVLMQAHALRTALLVTSAAHMPRAMAAFRRAGVEVTAASTDLRVRYPLFDSALDFMPDAEALNRTSDAIREWIGLVAYRLRGWA